MNKKSFLWIILDLIFLVVFNTVFFIVGGFHHPASVWISYGFIHFAYLMVIVTPFLIRKSSNAAVFGFSLYSISSTYFLVEFIVGLIFVLLRSESFKSALVVQIIIAALYAIVLISHLIANESTADSVERHEQEVAYIKNAATKVKSLLGKAPDRKSNKEIEKLYDALHSSPTKTSPQVHNLEVDIMNQISALADATFSGDSTAIVSMAKRGCSMVEERNSLLRLSN